MLVSKVYMVQLEFDLTYHIMVEMDTVIALANLTYNAEIYTYKLHPNDEKVFNDFITRNP
jgi:hypothetical protein